MSNNILHTEREKSKYIYYILYYIYNIYMYIRDAYIYIHEKFELDY